MRATLAFLLILASPLCLAQKWVDEKGKVYYGTPPPGVKVKPAALTGGATSSVTSQGGGSSSASQASRQPPPPAIPGNPYTPQQMRAMEEAGRENNQRMNQAARDLKLRQQGKFEEQQRREAVQERLKARRECEALRRC